MNRLLTILLLLGATAHGQIDNPPTSVNIVDSTATGRAVLTATNAAAARTSIGLGWSALTNSNSSSFFQQILSSSDESVYPRIPATQLLAAGSSVGGIDPTNYPTGLALKYVSTPDDGTGGIPPDDDTWTVTSPSKFRDAISLGTINSPTFRGLTLDGGTFDDAVGLVMLNSSGPWSIFSISVADSPSLDQVGIDLRLGSLYVQKDGRLYQKIGGAIGDPSEWGKLLHLDADGGATNARSSLGLATTNNVTFSNITASGTLTATGNVTLSGVNNTMPNATNAASGASLMTRNLYDERLPITFGLADQVQTDFGTVTLANGATGTKAAGGFELTTGASNNATAVWNASSGAQFGRKNTAGIGGVSTVWTGRVMVGWWFLQALSTNSEVRFQYGRAFNATTHAALSARGVGVRIVGNSVFFETHNGTTGFETTNVVTVTNPMLYSAIVEAGVAKFYAGQTLVATVTNSVPTNNTANNDFGWVMSISNTSTNSSIMRVLANPGFVMQQ